MLEQANKVQEVLESSNLQEILEDMVREMNVESFISCNEQALGSFNLMRNNIPVTISIKVEVDEEY